MIYDTGKVREPQMLDKGLESSLRDLFESWNVVASARYRVLFDRRTLNVIPLGDEGISYSGLGRINSGSEVALVNGVAVVSGMKTDPRIKEVRFYPTRTSYEQRKIE